MERIKNVLITGGSRGIGKACVEEFLKNGYRVFQNYNKTKPEKKDGVIAVKADISKLDEVKKMAEEVHKYGKLDCLVNNAGIAEQKLFSDISEDDWDRMFNINIKGMFLVTKEFLPDMIHNKYGKIINMSSIWGITGGSCEVHYSASKSAVTGFTKALAKEVGLSGVCVNCIAPGVIDTEMNANLNKEDFEVLCEETPLNRIGAAQEVAKLAVFLSGDGADFITGQVISPNGGIVC